MKTSLTVALLVAATEALYLDLDDGSIPEITLTQVENEPRLAPDYMKTTWKPGYTNPYVYFAEDYEEDPRREKDQVED